MHIKNGKCKLTAILLYRIRHILQQTKPLLFFSFKIRLLSISFSLVSFLIFAFLFFNNNNINFLVIDTNLSSLQYNSLERSFNFLQLVYANVDTYYENNQQNFPNSKFQIIQNNKKLLTYENQNLGIKFTYPSDWFKVENKNRLELRKTETKAGGPPIAMISLGYGFVDSKSKPLKISLEDLISSMLADRNEYEYKIINKQKFFVKSNPIYSHSTENPLTQRKTMDFYFNNPDQYILHIRYESSIKSFDLYLKDLPPIINSLQISPLQDANNNFENPLDNNHNSQSGESASVDEPSF